MICLAQMESIFAPFHQSYTGDSGSKLGVCAEKEGRAKEEKALQSVRFNNVPFYCDKIWMVTKQETKTTVGNKKIYG